MTPPIEIIWTWRPFLCTVELVRMLQKTREAAATHRPRCRDSPAVAEPSMSPCWRITTSLPFSTSVLEKVSWRSCDMAREEGGGGGGLEGGGGRFDRREDRS